MGFVSSKNRTKVRTITDSKPGNDHVLDIRQETKEKVDNEVEYARYAVKWESGFIDETDDSKDTAKEIGETLEVNSMSECGPQLNCETIEAVANSTGNMTTRLEVGDEIQNNTIDFVLSCNEIMQQTSMPVIEQISENINDCPLNIPPFATIMSAENKHFQDLDACDQEEIETKNPNATKLDLLKGEEVNEEIGNKNDIAITFDEVKVYKILEKYFQCVETELRNRHPSPEVIQKSQNSLRMLNEDVPRTVSGVAIPVPYVWNEHVPKLTFGIKSYSNVINVSKTMDRLTKESSRYDKLRLIFDTVMSVNDEKLRSTQMQDLGLDIIDENKDFHIELFCHLCRYVNIPHVTINGYRKLIPSEMKLLNWSTASQWVAVLYEERWMLIDPHPIDKKAWEVTCCLMFGSYQKRISSSDDLLRKQTEKQFFVNPVEFVYFYYPIASFWQLLCRPVTSDEWQNMMYLTPFFYEFKLCINTPTAFIVDMTEETFKTFEISFPSSRKLQFAAKFYDHNGNCLDNSARSCTYVETDTDIGLCVIKLYAPKNGVIKIFALDIDIMTIYTLVCCFYIKTTDDKNQPDSPEDKIGFPRNLHRLEWGPGNDTKLCGLLPISHKTSEIKTAEKSILIKLQRTIDEYMYDFNIERVFADDNDTISRRFVLFWYDSESITYRISNPMKGFVLFNVLKQDTLVGSYKASVCSYLIHFQNEPPCNCMPPIVENGKLGITKYGRKEKLISTDCVNGIIKGTTSGEVTLRLQKFSDIKIQPRLHLMTSCFHNMMRHLFVTYNDTLVIIKINLPRRGDYLLSIFSCADDDTDSQCLYNGLINVSKPSYRWSPYPELCMDRDYNVGNFSPKSGILASKTDIYFSVEIPKSVDVAAVSCKGWTHLDKTSDNIWEGLVTTGFAGTEVKIMARFEVGSDEFFRLLTYKVISAAEIDTKTKHQELLVKAKDCTDTLNFDEVLLDY